MIELFSLLLLGWDKTQVIPLSKTDFVHTRLTHSLEVSVVGRSLGRLVGKK
jgi:dGTPase